MRLALRQFFVTKSLAALQHEAEGDNRLRRVLGPFQLIMLGVGAMLGTGVYVLAGRAAAHYAGPAVIVSFAIAGAAAALAALCYSEMASMIPVAGSAYTYTYATMGELVAFIIGWDLILEYIMGASLVAVGWSGYFGAFCARLLGHPLPQAWMQAPLTWDETTHSLVQTGAYCNLPACLLCLLLTAILIVGVRQSARTNSVMVVIKFSVVLLFLIFAMPHVRLENYRPFIPANLGVFGRFGVSGIIQCITILYLGYIGFDAVSTAAQESSKPQRDMPVGILGAMAICTALYVLVAAVLVGIVPYAQLDVSHPLAVGIDATGQPWLSVVIEAGAVAGLASNALVMLLGQPRIFYAMARDGLLPRFAAQVSERFGTPHITTLVAGGLCAALSGLVPIDVLGEMCSIGTLFAFALVSVGVMVLRFRAPNAPRRFKIPGGILVPLMSCIISVALMCTANAATLWRLFGWMAAGGLFYMAYGRRHSVLRHQHLDIATAERRAA